MWHTTLNYRPGGVGFGANNFIYAFGKTVAMPRWLPAAEKISRSRTRLCHVFNAGIWHACFVETTGLDSENRHRNLKVGRKFDKTVDPATGAWYKEEAWAWCSRR